MSRIDAGSLCAVPRFAVPQVSCIHRVHKHELAVLEFVQRSMPPRSHLVHSDSSNSGAARGMEESPFVAAERFESKKAKLLAEAQVTNGSMRGVAGQLPPPTPCLSPWRRFDQLLIATCHRLSVGLCLAPGSQNGGAEVEEHDGCDRAELWLVPLAHIWQAGRPTRFPAYRWALVPIDPPQQQVCVRPDVPPSLEQLARALKGQARQTGATARTTPETVFFPPAR